MSITLQDWTVWLKIIIFQGETSWDTLPIALCKELRLLDLYCRVADTTGIDERAAVLRAITLVIDQVPCPRMKLTLDFAYASEQCVADYLLTWDWTSLLDSVQKNRRLHNLDVTIRAWELDEVKGLLMEHFEAYISAFRANTSYNSA